MNPEVYKGYDSIIYELFAFARRPGLYIGKEDLNLIEAFIGGMELSTNHQMMFKSDMVDFLFNKYKQNEKLQELKSNLNFHTLIEQINLIADESNSDSVFVFKNEAQSWLIEVSDKIRSSIFLKETITKLKNQLPKLIESEDVPYTNTFRSCPTDYVFKQLEEWKGDTLADSQYKLLKEINEENMRRNMEFFNKKDGQIDDKSKLRELATKLLSELKTIDNT